MKKKYYCAIDWNSQYCGDAVHQKYLKHIRGNILSMSTSFNDQNDKLHGIYFDTLNLEGYLKTSLVKKILEGKDKLVPSVQIYVMKKPIVGIEEVQSKQNFKIDTNNSVRQILDLRNSKVVSFFYKKISKSDSMQDEGQEMNDEKEEKDDPIIFVASLMFENIKIVKKDIIVDVFQYSGV